MNVKQLMVVVIKHVLIQLDHISVPAILALFIQQTKHFVKVLYISWRSITIILINCITDFDECSIDNGGCDHNCDNTIGSYECSCNNGYELASDGKKCQGMKAIKYVELANDSYFYTDNNECNTGNGECDHICNNTIGSYKCSCTNGFYLDSNGVSCKGLVIILYNYITLQIIISIDIDECITDNGGCNQTCINNNGSYTCLCHQGYEINDDVKSCQGEKSID